ncbi:beta-N-acetylglucosaminidase [Corynebacterium sp. 13CS0277]|uniref:glycoside hydrolase family 3 N-terminal domain-containing protein n=1 Tax=Corynebacterium sp. 13CS0277 TaxID=2071994 RepID=UPI000D047FCC|nr:glycoside hydrolase family 3 N-terminal domain-containing protein [Corynebacterium sp. 13CS0277]PRQ11840.1 beta-N-acetylglucosaminidase [Corynebacterium sp. 13CS0277]
MKRAGVKRGGAALVAAALVTGCSPTDPTAPVSQTSAHPTPASTPPTTTAHVPTETPSAAPTQAPAPEFDVRADAAHTLMVGVKDYADARTALAQGVGGIFIGSWTDPGLVAGDTHTIATLREEFPRPFQVAIDAEGGRVVRQSGLFGALPAPRVMASQWIPEAVQGAAYDLGTRLRAAGITVDFAPVVDLDGGPAGAAIGDRSFSEDPQVAAVYATAFGQGLLDAGVQPVFKHFPGHGHASGDTHTGEVTTPPLAQLRAADLLPYGQVLRLPGAAAMVGHMIVPDFGERLPSSLNPEVYGLLARGDYPGGAPFDGLVYTDDLSGMKAISATLPAGQAACEAVIAGADVALWISTDQVADATDCLVGAVESGRLDAARLHASAEKVRAAAALR